MLIAAARVAVKRSAQVHEQLNAALREAEVREARAQDDRLAELRRRTAEQESYGASAGEMEMDGTAGGGAAIAASASGGRGIDRDDPMLQWGLLHRPAGLTE
jgi:hypothetical protein